MLSFSLRPMTYVPEQVDANIAGIVHIMLSGGRSSFRSLYVQWAVGLDLLLTVNKKIPGFKATIVREDRFIRLVQAQLGSQNS
jgi:hypothetical protein